MNTRRKLIHALTQYDTKQSKKRGYNVYALAIYCDHAAQAAKLIDAGQPAAKVLPKFFLDRPLNIACKALGLSEDDTDMAFRIAK